MKGLTCHRRHQSRLRRFRRRSRLRRSRHQSRHRRSRRQSRHRRSRRRSRHRRFRRQSRLRRLILNRLLQREIGVGDVRLKMTGQKRPRLVADEQTPQQQPVAVSFLISSKWRQLEALLKRRCPLRFVLQHALSQQRNLRHALPQEGVVKALHRELVAFLLAPIFTQLEDHQLAE